MRRLFSALAFLSIIPVPERWKRGETNAMFAAYPAAGLLLGVMLAGAALAASLVLPPMLLAVFCIGLNILLTGAIHLDGLADCADAFYGRRDRARVLEILKDPRIGTMGGAAIGLSLLARFACFSTMPRAALLVGIAGGAALARTAVPVAMRLLPYVRIRGGILPGSASVSGLVTAGAAVCAALFFVLLPVPTAAAAAALACFWKLSWRKLGGCTGDVLGASIEIAELAFVTALAAEAAAGRVLGLLGALVAGA